MPAYRPVMAPEFVRVKSVPALMPPPVPEITPAFCTVRPLAADIPTLPLIVPVLTTSRNDEPSTDSTRTP